MRLTKYESNYESMFPYKLKDEELSTELDSIHKLGQLEDIEEELGIDLITLFKALKNGIWYKDYKDSDCIKFTKDIEEHINWKELIVPAKYTHISLSFKDYGKTWTLTKEELE